MNYTNRNIVINELIGLKARVMSSIDKKQRNISGIVIDETKNTIVLDTQSGMKSIIKKISVFKFYTGSDSFTVRGEEINFRPHERIEKAMKFYKSRKV
ncbi:MAG: ribonuclease P protein subunit [Candidatus Micrarchaeota archaeon]|nr:ribonuclease P protein subunit [Candidatus Micrarchaeota archaeon]MDE1834658.1 ribonuclease P protein subunit [Candidatus Micrarchaeota archaeon]MDE1859262.1 ribonuclease P protein subunit [Candidatus Micrarchaeota archaeon]